jgi:hypothetical protein
MSTAARTNMPCIQISGRGNAAGFAHDLQELEYDGDGSRRSRMEWNKQFNSAAERGAPSAP